MRQGSAAQVPEEEQEQYSGSQHLRNLDVTLLAQLADDLVRHTCVPLCQPFYL